MHRFKFFFPPLLALSLACEPTCAEQAYVKDSFEITLRTGPGTRNQVIGMPSSGQVVEVLESDGDWSRVRIRDERGSGKQGWAALVIFRPLLHLKWGIESFRQGLHGRIQILSFHHTGNAG